MPTKVRELTPITQAKKDDRACPICHPRKDRLREDQVWGVCPTNRKHEHAVPSTSSTHGES
jgi:hypothetical protein